MDSFNRITDFINKSPKTELHLHIEGSLEPELMFKLSKRNKVEIPFKDVGEKNIENPKFGLQYQH